MKITKFAQSTFLVENIAGKRLLIDPGKYNYDNGFHPRDYGKIDILVITHKHEDHHDINAEKILIDLWQPTIITNKELSMTHAFSGIKHLVKDVGDIFSEDSFEISFIATDHFAKCESLVNFGLYIVADNKSFYHTSDTRFMETCFYDHELVKGCTVLAVPISNRGVVMGVDDSIVFTAQIGPEMVIPMHYDSPKDKVRVGPKNFVESYNAHLENIPLLKEIKVVVLTFNESLNL